MDQPVIKALVMSKRKKALKHWPDERIINYLSSQDEITEWVLINDGLYGNHTKGTLYVCADDDDQRVIAVCEFLKRNGGKYSTLGQ